MASSDVLQIVRTSRIFNNHWMRLSMIARIINAEVCVICRSRRMARITQPRPWWFRYHSKNEFNNCFIIDGFHLTSRRPYLCPKTMKWRPYLCPKWILWDFSSILIQTFPIVSALQYGRWSREWKPSILRCHKETTCSAINWNDEYLSAKTSNSITN